MIDFVTNEAAYQATADQMERGLFTRLLKLGQRLLLLFFALRSQQSDRETYTTLKGDCLPYHRDIQRNYLSIFGKIPLWRPYFYKARVGRACPLDAELSLGEDSYSDMLREMAEYLEVYGVYHKAADMLERFFGLRLSSRALQAQVLTDAKDVLDYYAQKPAPEASTEAEVLVIQADGKGVPMIVGPPTSSPPVRLGKGQKRGHKKEALVTTAYTIAPAPRTPESVLQSYYDRSTSETSDDQEQAPRQTPQNKHIWATLEGKDAALERLVLRVQGRNGAHIHQRVALCDGCEALQTRIASHFPGFSQILDFIHANEYLWDVANALLGENDQQRCPWMLTRTRQLLSGMRWSLTGAERLLGLRAVAENDDWEAYHAYRKRKRHERLYQLSVSETQSLELLALAVAA